MLKRLKKLLIENNDQITIKSSVVIPVSKEHIDVVFKHVYEAKKFYKWFNSRPALWMKFSKPCMEEGCIGTIHFTMPFFYYRLKVVEVRPNESIILKSVNGPMQGEAFFNFSVVDEGILLENIHILSGINKFIHKYYVYGLVPNHVPFMNWRYSVLKKNILKELNMKGK